MTVLIIVNNNIINKTPTYKFLSNLITTTSKTKN